MKKIIFFILFLTNLVTAQVTKNDVKEILDLYGKYIHTGMCELEYEKVYEMYITQEKYDINIFYKGFTSSTLSGISLGAYESYLFNYKHSEWLPKPLENWYNWRPQTDAVFGKSLTWHKIFRATDYSFDRTAFNNWKKFYGVETFWSWNQLAAYLTHFTVKNTFATIIRDKFKYNEVFHSFDFDLIFDFSEFIR